MSLLALGSPLILAFLLAAGDAPESGTWHQLGLFLGRFHPLALHLPIGFVLALGLLELHAVWRREGAGRAIDPAVRLLLPLAFASAAAAASLGLLLSTEGGYDEDLIARHRTLGLAVVLVCGAAWLWELRHRGSGAGRDLWGYRGSLALCTALLLGAGYYGGSLAHGSNFLTQYLPQPLAGFLGNGAGGVQVAAAGDAMGEVLPILEARCFECHGAEKQKADLRLDSREAALAGGESGKPVIVPGDAVASQLVWRITLPREHDDVMPPAGNPKLTASEIVTLIHWVNRGAPWTGRLGALARGLPVVPGERLEQLRGAGAWVSQLARGNPLLQVSLAQNGSGGPELLEPVAKHVTWLSLAGRELAADAWASLAGMDNLTRLELQGSNADDAALAHLAGLPHLEHLNLYGTAVGDAGLLHLHGLPELRRVFLWRTRVSPEGAARLAEALPEARINLGGGAPGHDAEPAPDPGAGDGESGA